MSAFNHSMQAAIEAHLRMMARLPVRTHSKEFKDRSQGTRIGNSIPQELLDEVSALRNKGMRRADIIRELRLGTATYARILRILCNTPEEIRERVKELIKKGKSQRDISRIIGVSRSVIRKHLEEILEGA